MFQDTSKLNFKQESCRNENRYFLENFRQESLASLVNDLIKAEYESQRVCTLLRNHCVRSKLCILMTMYVLHGI